MNPRENSTQQLDTSLSVHTRNDIIDAGGAADTADHLSWMFGTSHALAKRACGSGKGRSWRAYTSCAADTALQNVKDAFGLHAMAVSIRSLLTSMQVLRAPTYHMGQQYCSMICCFARRLAGNPYLDILRRERVLEERPLIRQASWRHVCRPLLQKPLLVGSPP